MLRFNPIQQETIIIQKLTTIAIIGSALALAACNTVRGAGKDVQSAANCTENVINNVHC